MKRGEMKKSYGPEGPAQVTVGKRSVGVVLANPRIKYEFPLDAVPEELLAGSFTTGELKVSLSEDGTRVMKVSPWNEKCLVRVRNFGRDDAIPVPTHSDKPGHKKDGSTYPRDYFWFGVNLTVQSGKLAGLNTFGLLTYYDKKGGGFAPDEMGQMTILVGKNKDVQKLESFLQATGVSDIDFPWSDNILPVLLAAIKKLNREFAVTVENGWPSSYEAVAQTKPVRKSRSK